MVMSEL